MNQQVVRYARFDKFYAKYWNVSPETFYKVRNYSNSRQSVYLEGVHGATALLVPVSILHFDNILRIDQ